MTNVKKKIKIAYYDHVPYLGGKEMATLELIKAMEDKEVYYVYSGKPRDMKLFEMFKPYCNIVDLEETGEAFECDVVIWETVWQYDPRIIAKKKILVLHGIGGIGQQSVFNKIKFDKIVAISESCAKFYRTKFGLECEVIHNIIDINKIIEKSKEPYILPLGKGRDLTLCTNSRLGSEKGIEKLQFLARILCFSKVKFVWYVVGDFVADKFKERMLKIYSNIPNVVFLGKMDNPHKVVIQCDFIVQLSTLETQGLSVAEAKILGKRAILSDIPAFREFFPNDIIIKNGGYDKSLVERIMKIKDIKPEPYVYDNSKAIKRWKEIIYEE